MIPQRPAWSAAFVRDSIEAVNPIAPIDNVTREWAWGGSTGRGVKVAVIDSGIEAEHPAVGGVNGYVTVTEGPDGLAYDQAPHGDTFGHGTSCAGIIRGLAPECELYSVKVLGTGPGAGRGTVFAGGLRWAVGNGMQVCNLSLGTSRKDFFGLLHELADLAYFRGVMLVTAANNMSTPHFPSVYASVISVGSHDVPDPYLFYYNPKPPVEFGAWGIDVRIAWLKGWMSGTGNSYAAPHITGLVTKILGKHPNLTVFQMKAILRALAANVSIQTPSAPAEDVPTDDAG